MIGLAILFMVIYGGAYLGAHGQVCIDRGDEVKGYALWAGAFALCVAFAIVAVSSR